MSTNTVSINTVSTNTVSTDTITSTRRDIRRDILGAPALRPDGADKVQGKFAFSSDIRAENMLWGATLRSPHPYARIVSIEIAAALEIDGVKAIITADDVPGKKTYGLISSDQPVFASDFVRYVGEPVACIAADHPETCRRALAAIKVIYEVLTPLTDPELALLPETPKIHPDGNMLRYQKIICGDQTIQGEIIVENTYELGMQDQAFLGLEAALAFPDSGEAGVELVIATQWIHEDQKQIAACLDLPVDKVRVTLGGVGGAFGAREDISLQVHCCLLALRTRRPIKMQYSREESFYGHVHRHPAKIWIRHHATNEGMIQRIESKMVFDGGAYASTSSAVLINGVTHIQGPYKCESATVHGFAVRTNNPPCGAMRGFGVVQACFSHESQMDKLAVACGLSPVEIRLRNAMHTGDKLITGQVVESVAPVERCIRETDAIPMPAPLARDANPLELVGGSGLTSLPQNIVRGIGWGVSIKNLMYSEKFDDYATARCQLHDGIVNLKFATAEVGQGFVVLAPQIARSVLGVDEVIIDPVDTRIGSAGSTSASRQTWMSGGAVDGACRLVRQQLFEHVGKMHNIDPIRLVIEDTDIVDMIGDFRISVLDASTGAHFDKTFEHHHRPTEHLDENGQGNCHVAFAFVAHRAVVDVDVELGLVKVIQIATAQDVGRVLNPIAAIGQVEGGIAQGLGLAVMEEIILDNGKIRNPSFTDYLLPTTLDMPDVIAVLIEEPEPQAPLGAKGIGEPPCISVTPAIAAAIRNATGRDLYRVPIRPQDICL